MSARSADVVVVGAGPAGIFTTLGLLRRGVSRVVMLEKRSEMIRRRCPSHHSSRGCRRCGTCAITSGWGGAGAYSDGKLTLSGSVGGFLGDYLPAAALEDYIREADLIYRTHGAPRKVFAPRGREAGELSSRAAAAGMEYVPCPVRAMGSDGSREVLRSLRSHLEGKVAIHFHTPVLRVNTHRGRVAGVETESGERYAAGAVVLAPGRGGALWLDRVAARLGLRVSANPVDVGVRVEVPAAVLAPLTDRFYEAKLLHRTAFFGDLVRTFCMCPRGEVVTESSEGLCTVNGQSYRRRKTGKSNVALLVRTTFTHPFHDAIAYGRHIAELANLLSTGILVQRWGDLTAGRRTDAARLAANALSPTLGGAVPGDLSFVLPYRILADLKETMAAMDLVVPGFASPDTLLYGVEAKYYSNRLELSPAMETAIRGLYAVGDGAGVSRGLIQASCSGMIAADAIGGGGAGA
jgi:hypothetical protein